MAEFQEVIRQYERMCSMTKCTSSDCPILRHAIAFDDCDTLICKSPKVAEEVIMEWAANHPEHVYPTWQQWQNETFPNNGSADGIYPCDFMPLSKNCMRGSWYSDCEQCRKQRIPADIAAKLGVEPGDYQ